MNLTFTFCLFVRLLGSTSMTYQNVGFYTQIIWAKTQQVGCAAALCTTGVYYVCNYAPR